MATVLALGWQCLPAQTINGVTDKAVYSGQASFTVQAEAGAEIAATLNGEAVTVGEAHIVTRMDFYELIASRTPPGDGPTTTAAVRFIVLSPQRGTPERGMIQWTPYPLIASAAGEFEGARLDLIVPRDYPQGLEIPVVAWVRDDLDNEVRVNGEITASGHEGHAIRVLRGAGSGFLPAATSAGALPYQARLRSLASDKVVNIDSATAWTEVAGTLGGTTDWPANSRIHLTADLTVPAGSSLTIGEGTVVLVDHAVNIACAGAISIHGTVTRPVVLTPAGPVLPEMHDNAWGGFVLDGAGASLDARGTILVGGGAATSWNFSPGSSHRSEQAVLLARNGAVVKLTDSAVINSAGQVGNGYNSDFTYLRTLVQRAITCGEYVGGTITLDHAALIEFPADDGVVDAAIADADYDAIYFTTGTHILRNSLIGFCKDDAIDSGSGGAGTVLVENCWVESALHEAMAWSGGGRVTDTRDTVAINNGQGFECGWSTGADSPLCTGERMLLTGNAVGARFGDNYDWTYNGQLNVTSSLILHNYRDVWGYNWADWTYRDGQMDVHGNKLTAADSRHPNNTVWAPETDAALLAPFMTTPAAAPVGIGIASWSKQDDMTAAGNSLPVRLSSFTTLPVSVQWQVQDASAAVLGSGLLTFAPGETVKFIPVDVPDLATHELLRVSLLEPVNGELTGATSHWFVSAGNGGVPAETSLVARGAVWKYHDLGSDLGSGWRAPGFDDSAWKAGSAVLGAGDSFDVTTINIGPSGGRWPTVYFRKTIPITDPGRSAGLRFGLRRDDGAVIYVNGSEVYRDSNVPAGAGYSTYATGLTPSETAYQTISVPASSLVAGDNVIAVEVHQESSTSSDLHFDLELSGTMLPDLKIANFYSDLLLYWFDPSFALERSDDLAGPWTPVGGPSPVEVVPGKPREFFRLKGP